MQWEEFESRWEVNLIAESAATGLTLGTPLAIAVLLAAMLLICI